VQTLAFNCFLILFAKKGATKQKAYILLGPRKVDRMLSNLLKSDCSSCCPPVPPYTGVGAGAGGVGGITIGWCCCTAGWLGLVRGTFGGVVPPSKQWNPGTHSHCWVSWLKVRCFMDLTVLPCTAQHHTSSLEARFDVLRCC
jgi:hypothetical protein